MNRAEDLRSQYDILWERFVNAEAKDVANLSRELRLIGEKLEQLEPTKEVALVDELAAKRAKAGSDRPPARRKSG